MSRRRFLNGAACAATAALTPALATTGEETALYYNGKTLLMTVPKQAAWDCTRHLNSLHNDRPAGYHYVTSFPHQDYVWYHLPPTARFDTPAFKCTQRYVGPWAPGGAREKDWLKLSPSISHPHQP